MILQLWLTLDNANFAENMSINYILCETHKKNYKQNLFMKNMYRLYYVSMVDIIKI